MASPRRQRENKFYEPGIRGRKTGATVPANLQVDQHGLENVDDFFNSDGSDDDFDGPVQVTKSPRRSLANELLAMSARTSIGAPRSPSSPRRTVISSYRSSNRDNTNSEQVSMDIATTQSSPKRSFKSPVAKSSPVSRRTSSVRTPEIMPDVDDDDEPALDYAPASDKVRRKLDFSLLRKEPPSERRPTVASPISGQKRRRGGTMLISQQRVSRQSSSDMDISEDDQDEHQPPVRNNKQLLPHDQSSESEDVSDQDLPPQSQTKRKQTIQRARDYLEEEDEDEDAEDRVDPVVPSPARRVPISPALSLSISPSPSPPPPPRPKASPARIKAAQSKAAPAKKQPAASARPAAKTKPKPKAPAPARTLQRAESETSEADGTRRSNRQRIQPLEFWRNERIVYGSRKSGENVVPVIRQVVRVPSAEPEKKPRKRASTKTKRPRLSIIEENREAGMDKDTDPVAIVKDYETEEEIRLQIACTADMIQPRRVANASYNFEKVFQADFISSGVMHLPKGGFKEPKLSGHNTFMFYIIEGAAEVTVHLSTFIIATGGMFMVPRGNEYEIRNVADRMTKLFFTQARRLTASVDDQTQSQSQSQSQSQR